MRLVDPTSDNRIHPTLLRAVVETIESRLMLSAATLDDGFADHGKLVAPMDDDSRAYAVQMLADGKMLLAGKTGGDMLVMKLLANGAPDDSFGAGGKVVVDLGSNFDVAYAMTVQSDGKILLAGQFAQSSANYDFAVVRLMADGTLDSAFGVNGAVIKDIAGNFDQAIGVAETATGIAVAGSSGDGVGVMRLTPSGQMLGSFGVNGVATMSVPDVLITSVAFMSDGHVVFGGTHAEYDENFEFSSDFAVVRMNPDGSADKTFGSASVAKVDMGSGNDALQAIALGAGGAVWAVGTSNGEFAVLKLNASGAADKSFNGTGKMIVSFGATDDVAEAVAVMADGTLMVAGHADGDAAVVSLMDDGNLDTSFGLGGKMTLDLGNNIESMLAISAGANAVVMGGFSAVLDESFEPDGDVAAIRLTLPTPPPPPPDDDDDPPPGEDDPPPDDNHEPPTLSIAGSATGVRGQALSFSATATGEGLEIAWDFGDGKSITFMQLTHPGATSPSHVFVAEGTYTVSATVRDVAGATATTSVTVTVTSFALQVDPSNPKKMNFVVGGTEGKDVIVFGKSCNRKKPGVIMQLNGKKYGPFNFNGRIIAFGQAGDDLIGLKGPNWTACEFYGGDGNDLLKGSRAADKLVGGDGDDWIIKGCSKGDIVDPGPGVNHVRWRRWRPMIKTGILSNHW